MSACGDLNRVASHLDRVVTRLASGAHQDLHEEAAELAASTAVLRQLTQSAREDRPSAEALSRLLAIRHKIALIAEMLAYAEQVRSGTAAIVALAYTAQTGSQYSSDGVARLVPSPRMVAEA